MDKTKEKVEKIMDCKRMNQPKQKKIKKIMDGKRMTGPNKQIEKITECK